MPQKAKYQALINQVGRKEYEYMMTTDPVSDMLARIRNAMLVGKRTTNVPHSTLRVSTLEVLKESGYIHNFKVVESKPQSLITVQIAADGQPFTITEMKRESKPGRRLYVKAQDIPRVKNGRGITIVSTSQGVMTGDQARSKGVGGEIICSVY